jgi:KaiC/GvpD/RAD55 family RecA-like ATPase
MPRIPLIEDLTSSSIPAGSNLLVQYDPPSLWYNAHVTIAAGWLATGGKAIYHIAAQPVERVRAQLKILGVDDEQLAETHQRQQVLALNDWYTATLGPTDRADDFSFASLKVQYLSIEWSKGEKEAHTRGLIGQAGVHSLRILDDASCLARFNDEKAWVEFLLTRLIPRAHRWKEVSMFGLMRNVHSDWVYKTLEGAADGVVDFKLDETGEETRDLVRIRSMRHVRFDRKWHKLIVGDDHRVSLE